MLQRGAHFLFSLELDDRPTQSVRVIGGVIIAAEDPVYVGRMLVGAEAVEDKSELVAGTTLGQRTLDALEQIAEHPGIKITREHGELFILFDDPAMTEQRTTVVFSRMGQRTSFVRKTDRYDSMLRDFTSELGARQR